MKSKVVWIVIVVIGFFLGFIAGMFTEKGISKGSGESLSEAQKKMILYQSALSLAFRDESVAKDLIKGLDSDSLDSDALRKAYEKAKKSITTPSRSRRDEDPNKVYNVDIGRSHTKGPKDAPITLVEFSEFQCPFCGRAHKTMKQLEEAYPGKIRFVFKSKILPSHSKAPLAHNAVLAAGDQGKFWEMHDLIFSNQRKLGEEAYIEYATQLGLDLEKFKADMKSNKYKDLLAVEGSQADKLGVRGTPTFFINGRKVRGAKPFESFKSVIDEELSKKKG